MPNAAIVNFAAGETSPRSRGRFDLDWFRAAARKILNFIPEVQGPAHYRTGFKVRAQTRGGAVARLVRFHVNDEQDYTLEFTPGFMRVYKGEDLHTLARTTITAATKANPCVITVASTTGLANGDEIILTGVVGMPELNGRQVKLAGNVGSTYQLVDPVTGSNINSTNFGTYVSGGTLREVYEIASPYLAADLDDLFWAVSARDSVAYFAHLRYAPRKLTVDSNDTFTLGTYARTADPFAVTTAYIASQINRGTTTTILFPTATVIYESAVYTFSGCTSTVQINGTPYRFVVGTNNGPGVLVELVNATTGASIDSSAWTAYTTGDATATPDAEHPLSVAFYEGRLFFIGTDRRTTAIFGSRAPDESDPRYDDYTGGTDPDHAVFYALAPVSGRPATLAWGQGTSKYLICGTFGGPVRISGAGLDEPLSPVDLPTIRQFDSYGCEAVMPVAGSRVFWIQRGGTDLRTARFSADDDDMRSYSMMLNAEHIADSRLRRVALQVGHPDVLWAIREDGVLAGMTVQGEENVAGWHRQKVGGTAAMVLDVQSRSRSDRDDQLWIVTERTVNGTTRRFVEASVDDVVFQDKEDFYSGPANRTADLAAWANATYRRQEEYIHLDAAGTYNGSDRGVAAAATLTLSAATVGTGRTVTASAAVFRAGDVGSEIWRKPDRDTGVGAGRAIITGYTDSTHVTVEIDVAFNSVGPIAAGEWYFAVDTIYVPHLDGATVAVVTDGAVYSDGLGTEGYPVVTLANCAFTMTSKAAVVHVGFPYEGFVQTHNLELSTGGGPAQSKPRNISELFIRFLNTLGVDYGTNIYNLTPIEWRSPADVSDRPAPVFSGVRPVTQFDGWSGKDAEKCVVISQRLPLPCVVQSIDVRYETSEGD